MGLFSKDIKSLDDLFVHQLQDIYYAEHQITKALPKMIDKATDPQLRSGFEAHLKETQNQITRLEQVFKMHGHTPKGVDCPALDGLVKEANEVAGEVADRIIGSGRDRLVWPQQPKIYPTLSGPACAKTPIPQMFQNVSVCGRKLV